jgi:hypothetical protein
MHRHGARNESERPATCLADGVEIDARAVESEAPSEGGEHEDGRDDPPAEKHSMVGIRGHRSSLYSGA